MEKLERRKFLGLTITAAGAVTLASVAGLPLDAFALEASRPAFTFSQIPLPYAYNALEPAIDAMTMEIHYTKHHATYVKNVNEAIKAENLTYQNELDFFANASKLSAKVKNNAGGVWNHNFFWESMHPTPESKPTGKLKIAIEQSFSSLKVLKEEFSKAALAQFGSGWAWLTVVDGKLKIGSTPNQDNPLMDNVAFRGTPLLALDVWEHAYYLKYQNKRADYIDAWWQLVNWEKVGQRML